MTTTTMVYFGVELARARSVIVAHDGTILANYGQSLLVRISQQGEVALAEAGFRIREVTPGATLAVRGGEVDLSEPATRSTSFSASLDATSSGRTHQLLLLAGPMAAEWKVELEGLSVTFHESVAENTYLIEVDADKIDDLQALPYVDNVAPYYAPLKINPELMVQPVQAALAGHPGLTLVAPEYDEQAERKGKTPRTVRTSSQPGEVAAPLSLELALFPGANAWAVAEEVRSLGGTVDQVDDQSVIVTAEPELLAQLARIQHVREINPYSPRQLRNNVAASIIGADTLLSIHGLDGSGQIVAIADTGLDNGQNNGSTSADFRDRIVLIQALGRPGDASDPDGHGTHVAGSVLGSGANSGGHVRGIAPAAQLVFQSVLDPTGGLGGLPANLGTGLLDLARGSGARIHSNSWGADVNGAYNLDSQQVDAFTFANREFLACFAAGNEAPHRVNAPGSAKNALTVGASKSLRALPALVSFIPSPRFPSGVASNTFDDQADDQNQVSDFSCPGPAQSNRRKPDVVAPGSWILSARSSAAVYDAGPDGLGPNEVGPGPGYPEGGTGDENGVLSHPEAVGLGLPGQPILRSGSAPTPPAPAGAGPAAETSYMYLSGTSMATPIAAGACALVRQFLVDRRGHLPSAALVKAMIVNGARDMGSGVPNHRQGWGRIDLVQTLAPATGTVEFNDRLDAAVATGEIRQYRAVVPPGAAALAVTLAWRDAVGSTIQNRLHLRVIHPATGATWQSDPIDDIRNNVQKVIVPVPAPGQYGVEVEGVNVMAGVPELAPALRQDYALVAANVSQLVDESLAATYQINRVFVRRNRRWPYIIVGATVVDSAGALVAPEDGVAVNMAATQGARSVQSGDLPYYDRGQYHIWRLRLAEAGLAPGPAQVDVTARADGAVVDTATQSIVL